MWEHFRGWRRMLGIVTLLLALACTGAWIRSRSTTTIDQFSFCPQQFNFHLLSSRGGSIMWQKVVPVEGLKSLAELPPLTAELFPEFAEMNADNLISQLLSNQAPFHFHWNFRYCGFEVGEQTISSTLGEIRFTIWKISHWTLIMPLTLISAFLLLPKQRLSNPMTAIGPNANGATVDKGRERAP